MGITLEDFIQEVEGVQLADIPSTVQQTINEALSDTNSEVYGPEKSELSPCTPTSIADEAMRRKSVYNEFKKLYSPQKQKEGVADAVFPNLTDLVSKPSIVSALEEAQSFSEEAQGTTTANLLTAGHSPQESGSVTSPGPGSDGAEEARQELERLVNRADKVINSASELSSDVQNVFTPVFSDSQPPEFVRKKEVRTALAFEIKALSAEKLPNIRQWSNITLEDYNAGPIGSIRLEGIKYIRKTAETTLDVLFEFIEDIQDLRDKCLPGDTPIT